MGVTPVRFVQEGEKAHRPSIANRAGGDLLSGSGYLANGTDFAGFVRKVDIDNAFALLAIVDAQNEGALVNGTDDRTHLFNSDALAFGTKVHVLRAGTYTVGSDLTLTASTMMMPGSILKPTAGVTITLKGGFGATFGKHFDLSAGGKILWHPLSTEDIHPEWFGAAGDAVADDTTPFQQTLDSAMASNDLGSVLNIDPRGRYKITNSLRGFRWNAGVFTFTMFSMFSRAQGYPSTKAIEIVTTFTDRPGMILQAARAVNMSAVIFRGALVNVNPTYDQAVRDIGGAAGTPWWNNANAGRDSKYSPYCGVAIDPFSNGLPPDGGIPGHAAYYTQNIGSAMIKLEKCGATNFIVAFATSLSVGSQNAEDITFEDCFTENVKVCYSIGQSQNRNVNILRPRAVFIRSLVDTYNYGVGNGVFPNIVGGDVAGMCKWLIICGTPDWAFGTIKQLYAEGVISFGFWGWNNNGFPLTLDDCSINILDTPDGVPAPASHLHSSAPVILRGGFFGKYIGASTRQSFFGGSINLDHVALTGLPMMQRYGGANEYNHPSFYYTPNGAVGNYGIQSRLAEIMAVFAPNQDAWLAPMAEVIESITPTEYRRWRWRETEVVIPIDNAANITVNADGTATFTSVQAWPMLKVGDYIATRNPTWNAEKFNAVLANVAYQGMSIGRVKTLGAANLVTLDQVPISMVSGVHNLALRYLPVFRPRTIGTSTNGTPNLTNVSPMSQWKVNDRINGTNIPAGTYIVALNVGAGTMTLSQNATGTGTVELYDQKLFLEDACRNAVPSADVWFQGDFVRNIAGTKDASNMIPVGWRCTVSGRGDGVAPAATFETQYVSTVTPAT